MELASPCTKVGCTVRALQTPLWLSIRCSIPPLPPLPPLPLLGPRLLSVPLLGPRLPPLPPLPPLLPFQQSRTDSKKVATSSVPKSHSQHRCQHRLPHYHCPPLQDPGRRRRLRKRLARLHMIWYPLRGRCTLRRLPYLLDLCRWQRLQHPLQLPPHTCTPPNVHGRIRSATERPPRLPGRRKKLVNSLRKYLPLRPRPNLYRRCRRRRRHRHRRRPDRH